MKLKQLREQRAQAVQTADEIVKQAESENRNLSSDEKQKVEQAIDDKQAYEKEIKLIEQTQNVKQELEESNQKQADEEGKSVQDKRDEKELQRSAFKKSLLYGQNAYQKMDKHEQNALRKLKYKETRADPAMEAGDDDWGGTLVPEEFRPLWEAALTHLSEIRQWAFIMPTTTGRDMPMPTTDDTSEEGEIIGEDQETGTQRISTGSKTLESFIFSTKEVPISRSLIQDEGVESFMQIVQDLMALRVARRLRRALHGGSGSGEPEGYVTAAPTVNIASTSSLSRDDIRELIHGVERVYRRNESSALALNDNTEKDLALLDVGSDDARPLWQPSMSEGIPDRIEGYPYFVDPNLDDVAPGNTPMAFGDWSKYMIRDVATLELMQLNETRALRYEIAMVGFSRHDARLLDAGTGPIKTLEIGT